MKSGAILRSIHIEWTGWAALPAAIMFAWSYLLFGVAGGLLATLLIILSLVAHEGAHIVVSAANQVAVTALGFCGLGTYIRRKQSQSFRSEFVISSAGPAASLLLAMLFWTAGGVIGEFLGRLNFVIAVSNLLPIGATDGNRALDAFCRILNSWQATGK